MLETTRAAPKTLAVGAVVATPTDDPTVDSTDPSGFRRLPAIYTAYTGAVRFYPRSHRRRSMSQDPDDDARREEADARDIQTDDWPVDEEQSAGTATTGTGGAATIIGASHTSAVAYDEETGTLFEADVDEETDRLVRREGTERQVESTETLGEAVEDLGERLEWNSLSAFARNRLQTSESDADDDEGPRLEGTFTQSNVAASADHDLEFTGSYTYRSPDEREFVVERTFEVTVDDRDRTRDARVDVTDRLLRTADPNPGERGGEGDIVREGHTEFTIDVDQHPEIDLETDRQGIQNLIEDQIREWHAAHVEPIA